MKKQIFLILFLVVSSLYSQNEIPKLFNSIQSGYYKIYFNGVEQPENYTRFDKMLVAKMNLKFFYPDADITHKDPSNRIDIDKGLIPDIGINVNDIDTTFYAIQTNKIFDNITNARYFSIVYKPDSTNRHINVISVVAKDSLPKPLDCQECGTKPIKIRFKAKEIDGFIFDANEIEHEYIEAVIDTFRIVESVIRSSDSLIMKTQTYTNADYIFAYQESSDGVTWSDRLVFETSNAGQPTNYLAKDGIIYAILYRHTREFTMKYAKVIAIRRSDRKEVSTIYINPDM